MTNSDCHEVLMRLWAYLDGESDEAECQNLESHITRCLECRQHAGFEVRLLQIIQVKCRDEQAPQKLREDLHRLLTNYP